MTNAPNSPNPALSCDQFTDALGAFLERDVDETARAAVEAHALSCADCGRLLADLRALRIDAANLPELAPSRDLWSGISARIQTPVVELGGRAGWNGERQRRVSRVWLGLAAAGLVAITATVTHELTKRSVVVAVPPTVAATRTDSPATTTVQQVASAATTTPTPTPASPASTERATTSLAASRPSAQETYNSEIARLRAVVAQRRPQLDSATVAVIERNLKVIDDAIAQCRAALRKDPASQYLMESLNDALGTKIQLLRTAASLPSRA